MRYKWNEVYYFWDMLVFMYLPMFIMGILCIYATMTLGDQMNNDGHAFIWACGLVLIAWPFGFVWYWYPKRNKYKPLIFR